MVPLLTKPLGKIENNHDWNHMVLAREIDERLARLRLNVRRIDDSQLRPAASRFAAMKCRTSNASFVAA